MKDGTSSTQTLEEDIGSLVGVEKEPEPAQEPDPASSGTANEDGK